MLSICIPIYNTDVTELVNALHLQAISLSDPAEILLIDDASDAAVQQSNMALASLPLVRYEVLKKNIGRSKIRNLLGLKARFPLLLFMDCDLKIISSGFLKAYMDAGRDGSLVCGGHVYQQEKPRAEFALHWKYGRTREAIPAVVRQQNPWHSFMTACFLIPANVMYLLPFNEEISGYGHEDTLYGYQLMKKNIPVKHIHNPVIHTGLVPATIFIEKTHQAIQNLIALHTLTGKDQDFVKMVRLLSMQQKLGRYKLDGIVAWLYKQTARALRSHLSGANPRLRLFDAYKLGYLCRHSK